MAARSRDRLAHVHQPAITFERPDGEREMAHPQPRVAALVVVGRRPAPVLGEEQCQPVAGAGQVLFGVDRAEDGIGFDPVVEPADECLEERQTAGGLVHAAFSRLRHADLTASLLSRAGRASGIFALTGWPRPMSARLLASRASALVTSAARTSPPSATAGA